MDQKIPASNLLHFLAHIVYFFYSKCFIGLLNKNNNIKEEVLVEFTCKVSRMGSFQNCGLRVEGAK